MICTVQLDEEKSKHVGLAQESRFGSANLPQFAVAGKRHSCCTPAQKSVINNDVTATQCF